MMFSLLNERRKISEQVLEFQNLQMKKTNRAPELLHLIYD